MDMESDADEIYLNGKTFKRKAPNEVLDQRRLMRGFTRKVKKDVDLPSLKTQMTALGFER